MRRQQYSNEDHRTAEEKLVFDTLTDKMGSYRLHNGLYVLMGDLRSIDSLTDKMNIKDDRFLDRWYGKHMEDVLRYSLKRYSRLADGAIVLNPDGLVYDDHRVILHGYPKKIQPELRRGASHVFLASASLRPGITSFVCSAEKNTVEWIRRGELVDEARSANIEIS